MTSGGKGLGVIAVAVVGEQAAHADAELSVVGQGGAQEGQGGCGGLVGQDEGKGEAGVVVDGDVHVRPAGCPSSKRAVRSSLFRTNNILARPEMGRL